MVKYVEFDMEAAPDITPEEFAKMSGKEQIALIRRVLHNIQGRTFALAVGVVKYGRHDDSCDDPDECTCAFTPMQEIALETIEALGGRVGKDVTVN